MKEYFSGHHDTIIINEYLNSLPKGSTDFMAVYLLRKMGEEFVDGKLTKEEVSCFKTYQRISGRTETFIRQMKCYTFYSVLCHIAADDLLTPFEMMIKAEIDDPSWKGEAKSFSQKVSRWWHTRWKHPLVYNEWWLPAFITFIWRVIRQKKVVKD